MKRALLLQLGLVAGLLYCNLAAAVTVIPPLPTADLVGRYQASSFAGTYNNGDPITTAWMDTGGSNNANVTANVSNPTFSTALGFPTVRFSIAGNHGFTASGSPGIGPTSGFAYFGVLRSDPTTPITGAVTDGTLPYFWDRGPGSQALASLKGHAVAGQPKWGFQKRDNAGGGLGGPFSTTNISTSSLQIVAIRRNPGASQFEIWVDGVLEATTADPGTNLTPEPILIGNASGFGRGFTGDIADLLIYDSELSLEDFLAVGSNLEFLFGLDTAFPDVQIVPEPATIGMWTLLGMVGVVFAWRQRRRK